MLTPFGKHLRKLRIDKAIRLNELSEYVGVTSSYLSAIEFGKRNITDEIFGKISAYFNLNQTQQNELKKLADQSKKTLKIDNSNYDDLLVSFARKLPDLSDSQKTKILRILDSR
jgi:HTH-type transcriptional regulator, competence development regulator